MAVSVQAVRRAAVGRWSSERGSRKGGQNVRPSQRGADSPGVRDAPGDFKGLNPGQKARHGISRPADERQAMQAGPVEYMPGSKGPLGSPSEPGGLRGRDVRAAAAKRLGKA